MALVNDLALALLIYEADEPHSDVGPSEYFPKLSAETIAEWLARKHDGDCVKQPQLCMRCFAEHAMRKADWLLKRLCG